MTISYNLPILARIKIRLKKLILFLAIMGMILAVISPYAAGFYVEKKYNNLIAKVTDLIPGVKVTSKLQRKYFNSFLTTKIQINNNAFLDQFNTFNKQTIGDISPSNLDPIVLQHDILHIPFFKKQIATINTKIISGLPKCIEQNKNYKFLTTIGLNQRIKTTINGLEVKYTLNPNNDAKLLLQLGAINFKDDHKIFKFNLEIPRLIYAEGEQRIEVDNLQLKFNVGDNELGNNRVVQLATVIERLYLVEQSKALVRLADFTMEHKLEHNLTSNISFLRLNVLDYKFGPLATKWRLNNINLPLLTDVITKKVGPIKFPIKSEKINKYAFMEFGNWLLKYNPNLSLDLLLNTGHGQLKLLSDVMVDPKNTDWFVKQDLLDSLQANVAANIPKKLFFEIVTFMLEEKLKQEINMQSQPVYNPTKKHGSNMVKSFIYNKNPQELQKNLEIMVIERIAYLIKNNIIKENDDDFSLDLAIAEGSFYSRMNPFKIFSF